MRWNYKSILRVGKPPHGREFALQLTAHDGGERILGGARAE